MSYLAWLVPIALGMGVIGLMAFLWSIRSGQYDDLDGAAERVLLSDATDTPLRHVAWNDDGGPTKPQAMGTQKWNYGVRKGNDNVRERL